MHHLETTQGVRGTMTDDQILGIAGEFSEWTELGYAVVDKLGFARALLAASEASAEPVAWMSADAMLFTDDPIVVKYREDMIPLYARPASAENAQPVAVIGRDWQIFYAGIEPLKTLVDRHSLKIGDWLYSRPAPATDYAALHLTPEQAAKEAK